MIKELIKQFDKYTDGGKGNCMQALELMIKENPRLIVYCFDFVVKQIHNPLPRVKWEADTIMRDVSCSFPDRVVKIIPQLLENTRDKGTVVRWSAAFALGEIAKYNLKARTTLVPKIEAIIKKEQNNGVRNVYQKALKVINK